jgi:hypothetical protein
MAVIIGKFEPLVNLWIDHIASIGVVPAAGVINQPPGIILFVYDHMISKSADSTTPLEYIIAIATPSRLGDLLS